MAISKTALWRSHNSIQLLPHCQTCASPLCFCPLLGFLCFPISLGSQERSSSEHQAHGGHGLVFTMSARFMPTNASATDRLLTMRPKKTVRDRRVRCFGPEERSEAISLCRFRLASLGPAIGALSHPFHFFGREGSPKMDCRKRSILASLLEDLGFVGDRDE